MTATNAPAPLKAPFPYFGGKSAVAAEVWRRFGEVRNYVEPFFGSGAVLLGSPKAAPLETVNDANGYVSNFWRAVACDPEGVAKYADWPVNENDLHARHAWLVARKDDLRARLEGSPEWYDAKIAGWWCWGMSCWIGRGFCDGGPWRVVGGELHKVGGAGQGVNRQLPHLSDAGQGVNRQLPHLGDAGQGVLDYMARLSERLRRVRICCGDWSRVMKPAVTSHHGVTGIFLDPPYMHQVNGRDRDRMIYGEHDCGEVAASVGEWCVRNGEDPKLRIALCGYEGEHTLPGWKLMEWKARGGYESQASAPRGNSCRERIWFSPSCLRPANSRTLF